AQVMGSSVVQHGWVGTRSVYYSTGEIPALAAPWNLARSRAFDRLRQEAQLSGADGVIGIEMTAGNLGDAGNVELVVFGTAVRDSTLAAQRRGGSAQLGMCTLSGQDVDKLRRIGAEVCGVVGHTTVLSVQLGMNSSWAMNRGGMFGGGAGTNTEITEIAQGVYDARNRVMAEVRWQASEAGANEIVISMLDHTIDHYEYEQGGYRYHYFHVTMNVLGTAIRLGAHEPHPAPLSGPVMSINLGA
ncbi:MAG: heavy metal-binding domain-containing protein, partial [Solirubrobacteraceae bacterium]